MLINNIYSVIDDIVSNEKLIWDLRFLIIGDFLFSIGSSEMQDPAELIFKTTRNSYFNRIRVRATINTIFGYDWSKYILVHQKLLIGLRLNKSIKKNVVRTSKNNMWETVVYITLKINSFCESEKVLNISGKPFIIIDICGIKYSVSSFRNLLKVSSKKKEMESVAISYDGVIKSNQIGFIISKTYYDINKDIINNENQKLLHDVGCKNISEYYSKIKKILSNDLYSHKHFLNETIIRALKSDEEYIKIMQNFQKILCMDILNWDIFCKIFYLPSFMDNRGRQYYSTLLSPTFHILFRYLYKFEKDRDFRDLENSVFYNKIIKYKYVIKGFNLTDKENYILLVLLIEVGKFFIKGGGKHIIATQDIIATGLDNFKKKIFV